MGPAHLGPAQLARLLRLPEPTPEQAAVISAPLGPLAVIAGAGSGKSETMAARLVWLVANGMVRPDRVLGLTFTRKAAAEFADRVRSRLERLRRAGATERARRNTGRRGHRGPVRRGPGDRHLSRLRGPPGQRQRPAGGPRAVHAADHPGAVLAARRADRGRLRRPDGRGHLDAADGHRGRARPGRRPVRAPARHRATSPRSGSGSRPSRMRCRGGSPRPFGRLSPPSAPGSSSCRWSAGTRRPRRRARCWTTGTRWRWRPGSPAGTRRSGRPSAPATRSSCSTSTRTPATPSWCCCGRCSAAGTR